MYNWCASPQNIILQHHPRISWNEGRFWRVFPPDPTTNIGEVDQIATWHRDDNSQNLQSQNPGERPKTWDQQPRQISA